MTGIFGTTFEYHNFVTSAMIRVRFHLPSIVTLDSMSPISVPVGRCCRRHQRGTRERMGGNAHKI